jgi:hypothetical protein
MSGKMDVIAEIDRSYYELNSDGYYHTPEQQKEINDAYNESLRIAHEAKKAPHEW